MENVKGIINKSARLDTYGSTVFRYAYTVGLSFILAMGKFSPAIAPLGIAFAVSVENSMLPVSAAGAILGYFASFFTTVTTLRYSAGVIVGEIAVYALRTVLSPKFKRYTPSLATLLSVFLTGLTVAASTEFTFKSILEIISESIIGGLCAYFFFTVLNLPKEKKYLSRLTGLEITSILVFVSSAVLSLNGITLWYFTLSRIIGATIVLLSALYGKEKCGALIGICVGLVLSLDEGMSFVSGSFALGGILAGVFGRKSKFIGSIAFILTNGLMAIPSASWINAINLMYDLCISGIFILLCPSFITDKLAEYFSADEEELTVTGQRNVLRMRLLTAADSLKGVSGAVRSVLKIFERRCEPTIRDCVKTVTENVCSECEKRAECEKEKNTTSQFIREISLQAKNNGCYLKESVETNTCIKPYDVFLAINEEYNRYKNLTAIHTNMSKTSLIVADQFCSMSDYLAYMAEKLHDNELYEGEKSQNLQSVLAKDLGLDVLTCGVFLNKNKFYTEIYLKGTNTDISIEKIRKSTGIMLNREMEIPVTDTLSDGTVIVRMCEKTTYTVNYGGFQLSSENETWCGDSFDCFCDGKGNLIMILSDGMGTGKRAAADSVMTQSLASSLIRSDFSCESIPDIINSSMMIRSSEESTSTLDIAKINLYTGKADFYKAGANYSYVAKNGKLLKIEKPSMPLGILRNVQFEQAEVFLKDSDVLMLMSDGISENAKNLFKSILSRGEFSNASKLSRQLTKASVSCEKGKHPDDITVITAILTKNV